MKTRNIDEMSKFGQFMYSICNKWGIWMVKHPVLYWIIQLTWGLPMTIIGGIIFLFAFLFGEKLRKYYRVPYVQIGESWGGLDLGPYFICDNSDAASTKKHELGHCMGQASLLGPFFIFLVWIPSALRYWWRRLNPDKVKYTYDSIWFERSATDCGKLIVDYYHGLLHELIVKAPKYEVKHLLQKDLSDTFHFLKHDYCQGFDFEVYTDDYSMSYVLAWENPITFEIESWNCGCCNNYQLDMEDIAEHLSNLLDRSDCIDGKQ